VGRVATVLTILKYLGLALAAGSSIWGTVSDLTTSAPDGSKKLTPAGRVSIALTIVGLIISVISEDVQRRIAANQAAEEARRTNDIVIAGQPLTGLALTWEFHGLDNDLVQVLKKGDDDITKFLYHAQGNRNAAQEGALHRVEQLYPFLTALSRKLVKDNTSKKDSAKEEDAKKEEIPNVLVLLSLDDDQNAVVSFGFLQKDTPWSSTDKNKQSTRPPSVEADNNSFMGNSDLANWPSLDTKGNNATITWHLDPTTFSKSISRQNQFAIPTAKLPSVLHIALLFDIKDLPFDEGNFAAPLDLQFWFPLEGRHSRDGVTPPIVLSRGFSSSVRLVPNSSAVVVYDYDLSKVHETRFLDSYGEIGTESRCVIFEYQARSK
jgi:hypothetical protein